MSTKNSDKAKEVTQEHAQLARRQFIQATLGGLALSPLLLSSCGAEEPPLTPCAPAAASGTALGFDPLQVALDSALFPLAVQAGAMEQRRALLWTFASDEAPKRLVVWREDQGQLRAAFDEVVLPAEGFFRSWVEKLEPGAEYRYAFFDPAGTPPSKRSAVGRFRCPPAAGCTLPVTLAATVCTNMNYAPFAALSQTARHAVDALIHLGDISYNDGATTRQEFRQKWFTTLSDPGYQALMPHAGVYATWDDHEITDNSKLYDLPNEVRRAGTEAFFEHVPVPRFEGDRFWSSYRWGDTLEIYVLDCRSERQPETRETDDAIYISREQLSWLEGALTRSPCHFKVVMSSVPIVDLPSFWIEQQDRWVGYRSQREALLSVCDKLDNVWFLAGDFHLGAVWRIEAAGERRRMWEIVVGPGGNRNAAWIALEDNPSVLAKVAPAGQFAYFSSQIATTLMTFDPSTDSVRVQFLDPDSGEARLDQTFRQRS